MGEMNDPVGTSLLIIIVAVLCIVGLFILL